MAPMAVDEYTPSLPHMVHALGATVSLMQLSVTFYMLTFAIVQVVLGLLSDRFGRKPIVLWVFPLFFIGTLLCIFAHSAGMLIAGRLLQGAAMGVSACAPAMMSDSFSGKELAWVSGLFATVYSFIPISAPVIGGLLQDWFGWRSNFIFMLVLSAIIYLLLLIKMPETHKPGIEHKLSIKNILGNIATVVGNRQYITSVLATALTWTTFVVFSVMAPFLIEQRLGFNATAYGFMALVVGVGFLVGNLKNNFLLKRVKQSAVIWLGLLTMLVMALVLMLLPSLGLFNAWSVMLPIFVLMAGAGMAMPNLYGNAVAAVPEYAGIAGALIGGLILIVATIVTGLITRLHAHSVVAMAAVYLLMGVGAFVLNAFSKKKTVSN